MRPSVARADKGPIVIDGQKTTGDDIRSARPVFFYPKEAAQFVQALKAAAEGRTSPKPPPGRFRRAAEPASDNGTAVFWAVVCGNTDEDITCTTPPREGERLTGPKPAPPFPVPTDRF
ncbi:hypothetical protein [Streptomyces sp. 2P-4]|uniref:hypothetical protein n=1 Tax=Streptomyces sp. 2P-4 TaxID=2931974 RepID=UPI00254154B6|nr:hypothetical protein [Streptomyces sp. 2P-4]